MNRHSVAMLVVALVMAGCGNREQAGDTGPQVAARAPMAAGADAVAAVLQSPPDAAIAKVGFVVMSAPVVGVQSAVRLDLAAPKPVPLLQVTAEAADLAMDATSAQAGIALVTAGTVVSHEVRFTPQRAGLTEMIVRLRSGEAGNVKTIYAVPLLVAGAAAGG